MLWSVYETTEPLLQRDESAGQMNEEANQHAACLSTQMFQFRNIFWQDRQALSPEGDDNADHACVPPG